MSKRSELIDAVAGAINTFVSNKPLALRDVKLFNSVGGLIRLSRSEARRRLVGMLPELTTQLQEQYGITIVGISEKLFDEVGHRRVAAVTEELNEVWYRSCLPRAHCPVVGVVALPQGMAHPLAMCSVDRARKDCQTRVNNVVHRERCLQKLGQLPVSGERAEAVLQIPSNTEPVDAN